ncbi:hypothetical protein HK102_001060 [Quaeritorhiza haematococci]|nr:hypothetical protein HK102_001060 [Quaeritorhiza haematococci]
MSKSWSVEKYSKNYPQNSRPPSSQQQPQNRWYYLTGDIRVTLTGANVKVTTTGPDGQLSALENLDLTPSSIQQYQIFVAWKDTIVGFKYNADGEVRRFQLRFFSDATTQGFIASLSQYISCRWMNTFGPQQPQPSVTTTAPKAFTNAGMRARSFMPTGPARSGSVSMALQPAFQQTTPGQGFTMDTRSEPHPFSRPATPTTASTINPARGGPSPMDPRRPAQYVGGAQRQNTSRFAPPPPTPPSATSVEPALASQGFSSSQPGYNMPPSKRRMPATLDEFLGFDGDHSQARPKSGGSSTVNGKGISTITGVMPASGNMSSHRAFSNDGMSDDGRPTTAASNSRSVVFSGQTPSRQRDISPILISPQPARTPNKDPRVPRRPDTASADVDVNAHGALRPATSGSSWKGKANEHTGADDPRQQEPANPICVEKDSMLAAQPTPIVSEKMSDADMSRWIQKRLRDPIFLDLLDRVEGLWTERIMMDIVRV